MFSGFYTTETGYKYISQSVAGKTLVFTKGQYGDGTMPEGAVITAMTALVSPIADMPISKQNTIDRTAITTTQFSNVINGKVHAPFYFMEAGVFGKLKNADGTDDEDGPEALLFYTNALTTDKADYIPGTLTEFLINWPLTISGAENITVEISESLIYPTMADLNERTGYKATSGGTGDALTVEVENKALTDGQQLSITLESDLEAYATLSYNGGEALPIMNANGTEVVDGQQLAGTIMSVVYSEKDKCWYMTGGGSSAAIATEEEAKAGTDDTKMMTPLKVAMYVDEVLGDVNTILDSINGEVI